MTQKELIPSDLSVVILCYKEGQTAVDFIGEVKKHLDARGLTYELVIVANYFAREKDAPKVVENSRMLNALAAADKRIKMVERLKEGGFGWDMRSGIDAATKEVIAIIDGDGQVPAVDLIRVYDIFAQGEYDCVKTFRMRRDDGSWRSIISFGYNFFLKMMFPRVYTGDVNGKPKIFKRSALARMDLRSSDWFIDAEMLIQGSYMGFRFAEISANFNEMKHRESYIRPMAIFESVKNIIVYRMTRMNELKEKGK